ncbi:peptide chain release factor 1 [Photorhabdus sp. P32]|uniref:protein RtxH n=1 Tax=Photorhabdus sp. P32 TaxID=3117549 RepID=UPI00311ABBEC
MSEKFVQTISSVNYNKGVFSLYFVGQEPNRMANGIMAENDNELELKQVIHMPASGFMYMVSMVKNMLEDPRMAAEFDKLVAAGFLPNPQMVEEQTTSELIAEEPANAKKRPSKNTK